MINVGVMFSGSHANIHSTAFSKRYRIDLHIEVPAANYKDLASKETGESSEQIPERVICAREIQMKRFEGRKGTFCNADMQSKEIQAYCKLDDAGQELLKMAIMKLGLSARAHDRILKV